MWLPVPTQQRQRKVWQQSIDNNQEKATDTTTRAQDTHRMVVANKGVESHSMLTNAKAAANESNRMFHA